MVKFLLKDRTMANPRNIHEITASESKARGLGLLDEAARSRVPPWLGPSEDARCEAGPRRHPGRGELRLVRCVWRCATSGLGVVGR